MNTAVNSPAQESVAPASLHYAHSHPPYLAHHFAEPEQQLEAAKMGMWIFLLTEILLFGGIFCAYVVYRGQNLEMFHSAHKLLSVPLGATNTFILMASTIAMTFAIRAMQLGNRQQTVMLLIFTLVCAAAFLGIKYVEYSHKFHLGLLPGIYYTYDGSEGAIVGKNPHIFFGIYFAMTGVHALHVIAGMAVIAWMLVRTARGDFSAEYYTPLEMSGLYWHLVDIIWIFVFTLLYLIG